MAGMKDQNLNKVSIQLPLGGHSFSCEDLRRAVPQLPASGVVSIVLPTHKTTLVPMEILQTTDAVSCLAAVGLMPLPSECVVCSPAVDGMVAVMAVDGECHKMLCRELGSAVRYMSPLLSLHNADKEVVLSLVENVLYVRLYNDGLRFAEAMLLAEDADVIFMLQSLHNVYNIYNMRARIVDGESRLRALCKRLFRDVVCE